MIERSLVQRKKYSWKRQFFETEIAFLSEKDNLSFTLN